MGERGVEGVAFFGRQIVLAASHDRAVAAFAKTARAYRFERMIVASRPLVNRFWDGIKETHQPPRVVREHQPLMVVDRARLRGDRGEVLPRLARPTEWAAVAQSSAAMIEGELGYDPRSIAPDFNDNVRLMIGRGLWWVGERDGELCFFCNCGPRSPQTLQLQGIWTPPHLRGAGLASAALHGICDVLLREIPAISLYVNDFNTAALRLYERLGFSQAGEFKTMLF